MKLMSLHRGKCFSVSVTVKMKNAKNEFEWCKSWFLFFFFEMQSDESCCSDFWSEFTLHFSKLIFYNEYAIPEKSIHVIDNLNEKSLIGLCRS